VAEIEKDKNWDKEMAEVDRLLKRLPNADPTLGRGSEPTVRRPAVAGGPVSGERRRCGRAALAGSRRGRRWHWAC